MIELSCDLGEASDQEGRKIEEALWPMLDAVNVACGAHAGDERSMRHAARQAAQRGVILGAHPSYPDRAHFGRRSMRMAPEALARTLIEQIGALRSIAAEAGVPVQRVKAHGALYNDAHADPVLAATLVEAVRDADPSLSIVAAEESAVAVAARARGLHILREAFLDRRYTDQGALLSRKESGALLSVEQSVQQALSLLRDGVVISQSGRPLPIRFDTLCIHSDTPRAVERLRAVKQALSAQPDGV